VAAPAPPARVVVLVVLDAARARSFSCYGYARETTPRIDGLARGALLFDNAFSPAPYTRAAMTSLWTSREPGEPGTRKALRLSELLAAQGIHTAGVVGNPNAGALLAFDRGFAEFHEVEDPTRERADSLLPTVERILESRRGGRLFLYVHLREPHFPYDPPPPFRNRFGVPTLLPPEAGLDPDWIPSLNRRGGPSPDEAADLARLYDANLAFADDVVGRLRDRLAAAGLWAETALIVTADHGEALGEHGFAGHNEQVYDESTRIPLIVRRPGREALGAAGPKRVDALASLLDLAPTVAGLFGLPPEVATRAGFRSRSLIAPDFEEGGERTLMTRSAGDLPAFALRDHRMTLIVSSKGQAQLFDRQADPGETQDLAAAQPELLQRRLDALAAHRAALGRATETDEPRPSPRTQEALRALGYVR